MPDEKIGADVRSVTLALIARRAEGATLCPSEVARAMAASGGTEDWRGWMPHIHAEVERMVAAGLVALSWRGAARQIGDGPYRIALLPIEGRSPIRSQRLP